MDPFYFRALIRGLSILFYIYEFSLADVYVFEKNIRGTCVIVYGIVGFFQLRRGEHGSANFGICFLW